MPLSRRPMGGMRGFQRTKRCGTCWHKIAPDPSRAGEWPCVINENGALVNCACTSKLVRLYWSPPEFAASEAGFRRSVGDRAGTGERAR